MEDLKPLIELQDNDIEIRKIEKRLNEEIPLLLKEIQEGEERAELMVKQVEEKIEKNLKERRDIDLEIKSILETMGKHRAQLNTVKTNEAYKALIEEIEDDEEKKSSMEDRIIELMIEEEELQKEKKSNKEEFSKIREEFSKKKKLVLKEQKGLETRKRKLLEEREKLKEKIKPELLRLYVQIANKRNGIALSPVHDGFCSVCQIRIRPQVLEELKKGEKIIRCENCSRILYINEEKET